jgi:SAM-dependent methyltransferase
LNGDLDRHGMSDTRDFYDGLADSYHLIFENWGRSIHRQGQVLADVLRRWPTPTGLILDAAAGIGTQTLALAGQNFDVVCSDLSARALRRGRAEARRRNITTASAVADFRALPFRPGFADAVLACDNALPHLTSHDEIRAVLRELTRCVRPGGGLVVSMRDYVRQPAGTREVHPYGEREWNGRQYRVEQLWDWQGATYRLTMRICALEDGAPDLVSVQATYFAISIADVLELMAGVGLMDVQRLDGVFFQPLLIGTAPAAA